METLYLGYDTACWYWQNARNGAKTARNRSTRGALIDATSSVESIRQITGNTLFAGQHIHVVALKSGCRNADDITVHRITKKMPDRGFIRLSSRMYIASPELSFVQAAATLSFAQLVHYGYALCGQYVLDPASKSGTRERPPLTSRRRLAEFIECNAHLDGAVLARRALKYVLELSRSPRESTASIILSFPLRYGGMGLPKPLLNKRILIPLRLRGQTDRAFFEADFLWEECHVTAEYDSDAEHKEDDRRWIDAIKRNVLPNMGYTPVTITRMQLDKSREMDKTAEQLRLLLHVKPRKKPANYAQLKAQLRVDLGLPA